MNLLRFALPLVILCLQISSAQAQTTMKEAIHSYGSIVHSTYGESLRRAVLLQTAIENFAARPSVLTHTVAKESWTYARGAYGLSEAFRFYNGPIDSDEGPEGLLNSWPLDESYIDYVEGAPTAGIIGNVLEYPAITKELLNSLNQFDGEKNVSTGYHAIEFLLWGQDFFTDGPGQRSHLDYVTALNADRRRAYLLAATDLLVEHLSWLEKQWRPGLKNYRQEFESMKSTEALQKILTGVIFMAGDELSGERMYVAYDSQGQEDEHSCFSDTTHMDIQWNFWGIDYIVRATKILELPQLKNKDVSKRIKNRLVSIRSLLATIPVPFDQAIVSKKGRALILTSVEELEALAMDLAEISVILDARVDY
jgi:putative iron-regulated protein